MEEEHQKAVFKIIQSCKDNENSNEQSAYVDLNLSLGRFPSENYSTNRGVGNAYSLGSSNLSSSVHEYDFFASNSSQARHENKILHEYDFMGLTSSNLVSTNLSLALETPMNMNDFSDSNHICQSILSQNPSWDYTKESQSVSSNPIIENTVPIYDISFLKSLSGTTSNKSKAQGSFVSWDFAYPSTRSSETSMPLAPQYQQASSSSVEKNLQVKPDKKKKLSKDIPKVVTDGGNHNGAVIEGDLYRYDDGEVLIICDCHKSVFNPREFVMHGGGSGDVENPNRLIKVVGYDRH